MSSDIVEVRIQLLLKALQDLSVIPDENYPTLRQAILTVGGDDFVNGIRIALPDVVVGTVVLDGDGKPVLDDDGMEVMEFVTVQQDPFEVEKSVLVTVVKTVLQIAYSVRWLGSPLV
jgi:hypothetical protein